VSLSRLIAAAVIGALLGALCLTVAYALHPGYKYEAGQAVPPVLSGLHDSERDALGSFAWTSGRVVASLTGLDRRAPWTCTLRFRGARADGVEQPTVDAAVDRVTVARVTGTNEFHDLAFSLPAAGTAGATIVVTIAPTFSPGTADTRVLGVQVRTLSCQPAARAVWPPQHALMQAAGAAAVFAIASVALGLSLVGALVAALAVSVGQAVMMAIASGAHTSYPQTVLTGASVAVAAAFIARAAERTRGRSLSAEARAVCVVSSVALFLKLIALLHPAKPIIDAVFHGHRFDRVLAGSYLFTQPMPNGVEFPYAIGLYVFAAPWAWLTTDHAALMQIVTATTDVLAGALLYPVVARAWGDRRTALVAVLAFQLAPLPFVPLGNANLTNIFGQSVALAAVMAAVGWRLDPRRHVTLAAFLLVVTWAFCSHVSTVTTLSATLGVLAVLYYWRGDPARRRAAIVLVTTVAAALALSWFVYYGHFLDVYRTAYTQMFTASTEAGRGFMNTGERVADLFRQAVAGAGWPLLMLAVVGAWSVWRRGVRDALVSAMIAWAVVWVLFSASAVFANVGKAYVRYAAELLSRINLATLPLLAILAARGAAAGWDGTLPEDLRVPWRGVTVLLIGWAVTIAVRGWMAWFGS
jgi:hypothetical protein